MHPYTSSHSPELRGIIVTCVTAAALYMIAAAPARVLPSPEAAATSPAEQTVAHRASLPYYYFPSQFAAPIGPIDEAAPTF